LFDNYFFIQCGIKYHCKITIGFRIAVCFHWVEVFYFEGSNCYANPDLFPDVTLS
jgi:hypothetical protein